MRNARAMAGETWLFEAQNQLNRRKMKRSNRTVNCE